MVATATPATPGLPNTTQVAIGTRAMQNLRARLGSSRSGAGFVPNLEAMFRQYGINARTGQGLFGGAPDLKGYDAVNRAIAAQTWTSQDLETRQKEYRYGGLILESRIEDVQRDIDAMKKGVETNDPNYSTYIQDRGRYESALSEKQRQLTELSSKKEAAYGFSGLMDLAGQVYEGKAGQFTNLLSGLDKGIYLKQSLGGTWLSQAAASQQALGSVALKTRMQADLAPLMGEADAAKREGGYDFNLASFAPEARAAWEGYFDARTAAKGRNEQFDENKWALENPDAALRTIIQAPVAAQAQAETFQRWGTPKSTGTRQIFTTSKVNVLTPTNWQAGQETEENVAARESQLSQETMIIPSGSVARMSSQGKLVLRGIEGGKITDEARQQQAFLDRPDVTYEYTYHKGNRVLKATRKFANSALPEGSAWNAPDALMQNENYQRGLVSMAIAARETKSSLWGKPSGSLKERAGLSYVPGSTENLQKAQSFAAGAVGRHAYDATQLGQARAQEQISEAMKKGFDPNKETIEAFDQRMWQNQQTVVRR